MKNRRAVHLPETLARIREDLLSQAPDHIAVTGDLVNIGLPEEYEAAARWLGRLGPPERVSVVPGNHDIYTRLRGDPGVERWAQYMRGTVAPGQLVLSEPSHTAVERFPYVRRIGQVAIIGVNSAIPTPPFRAIGRIGEAQLAKLSRILTELAPTDVVRVVLVHHPALPWQASPAKALTDAAALEAILMQHGAELVLHGHNHRPMLSFRDWPGGTVPIVGVPSASVGRPYKNDALARYNLYRIADRGTPIEMVVRGLDEPGGNVVELGGNRLRPAPR